MIQRVLGSKGLVAYVLACATRLTLYFRWPFPADDLMLHLIALRAPAIYLGFKYTYTLFLFTTPYIAYSLVLSGLYIFAYRSSRKLKPKELPPYPDAAARSDLFLVLGEIHDPRRPAPSAEPYWLAIPERGLFTGIAIFGAIGTGKTSGCMYPYAEQLIAYRASDPDQRIGGLVLEVKGDFCHKVKDILTRHGRESDYVEVNLNADYRYNPLYNNLDAYALAYNIASLLNNLFGKGKEPFWQQAYTNLVKFIIQLHKVAYDYVTLFDVYECAINPELLESRIQEAERRIAGERFVLIDDVIFRAHPELEAFGFVPDGPSGNHKAVESKPLIDALRRQRRSTSAGLFLRRRHRSAEGGNPRSRETLVLQRLAAHREQAAHVNCRRYLSILSLFDDNPMVKRTFCPPKECYDPKLNADGKYGRPLPPFHELIEAGKVCALNFPISLNPGLAKAIGVMMKLDFQRAVINRIPHIEANPTQHFRQVFFICDEYQHFATVGENDPTGDEKFFALSRQPKCIPIVATQSISSLRSTLPGETWRTLMQTFRTKIFLALSDEFSAKIASELCGREDQWEVNYNISESGHDARVSLWTGKAIAHKANVTTSKSYNTLSDFRFDFKTFTELKNARA